MRPLAKLLRLTLPYARYEVMQGMGHMGPVTHATDVNRRLVAFLHAHELADDLEPLRVLA